MGCLCPAQSRTRFECGWPRGALMVIGLSRQPQNIGQTSQPGHTFQNLFKVNQLWLGPGHRLARLTSPNVRCMKYAPTWHLTCVIYCSHYYCRLDLLTLGGAVFDFLKFNNHISNWYFECAPRSLWNDFWKTNNSIGFCTKNAIIWYQILHIYPHALEPYIIPIYRQCNVLKIMSNCPATTEMWWIRLRTWLMFRI